jgi:BioD-like phosphotransacetylase family protein
LLARARCTDALGGGVLDASTTFTAIALFGNLQGPLFLVPQAISQVRTAACLAARARVSVASSLSTARESNVPVAPTCI